MVGEEFKVLHISYFPKVKDLQTVKGVDLELLAIMSYNTRSNETVKVPILYLCSGTLIY